MVLGGVPASSGGGGIFIIGYYRYGVSGERRETEVRVRARV